MTAKKPKKSEPVNEAELAELLARVTKANYAMGGLHAQAESRFREPLVKNQRSPELLAMKISQRYKNLRATVSYEVGLSLVIVSPIPHPPIDTNSGVAHMKRQLEALTKDASTEWPTYNEVKAYAEGVSDGSYGLQDLQEENRRLKEHRYGYPDPMFRYPWMMR